MVHIEIDR